MIGRAKKLLCFSRLEGLKKIFFSRLEGPRNEEKVEWKNWKMKGCVMK
jgi:hypothetical protein